MLTQRCDGGQAVGAERPAAPDVHDTAGFVAPDAVRCVAEQAARAKHWVRRFGDLHADAAAPVERELKGNVGRPAFGGQPNVVVFFNNIVL